MSAPKTNWPLRWFALGAGLGLVVLALLACSANCGAP